MGSPLRPKTASVLCLGVAVNAKKLRLACWPRLAMLRNSYSISASPSSSAFCLASARNCLAAQHVLQVGGGLAGLGAMGLVHDDGASPRGQNAVAFSPRSSASLSSCRETNGNFCSVVMMMGTAFSRASASCFECSSIFCTTPWRCSNW